MLDEHEFYVLWFQFYQMRESLERERERERDKNKREQNIVEGKYPL